MKNYAHLGEEERDIIGILRTQGKSLREIGNELGRSASTISRELKRNKHEFYGYLPHHAHGQTMTRRSASRKCGRLRDPFVRAFVEGQLNKGWSPELIAGRLSEQASEVSISHETIYQWIYEEAPDYIEKLARSHRKRRKRRRGRRRRFTVLPRRVSISKRPKLVDARKRSGDWEADIMRCAEGFFLQVLVERKTRYTKLSILPRRTSEHMHHALLKQLLPFDQKWRKTITYDNGSENTFHWKTDYDLKMKSYFCHPYHSWEKGTVENTIGLVRRFLPKKTKKQEISKRQVQDIELWLNHRPRKCLNFKTPYEALQMDSCT